MRLSEQENMQMFNCNQKGATSVYATPAMSLYKQTSPTYICTHMDLLIYLCINMWLFFLNTYMKLASYLSIYPSIHSFIKLSVYPSAYLFYVSIWSIDPSIYLSIYLSIHPSIHPLIRRTTWPVYLFYLSIWSIDPSIHPSIYSSIYVIFIFVFHACVWHVCEHVQLLQSLTLLSTYEFVLLLFVPW